MSEEIMVERRSLREALSLFEDGVPIRTRDVARAGVHTQSLTHLVARGTIERVGRGVYRKAGADADTWQSFAEATVRVPLAIICLSSAAVYHGLTTRNPSETWIALPSSHRVPVAGNPALRTKRWRNWDEVSRFGIETIAIDGVDVRITSPARTVVDLVRPRNRASSDLALEVLMEFLKAGGDPDLIKDYAGRLDCLRKLTPLLDVVASPSLNPF
jgi:predicted transcriptional regulator of viral defense system